MVSFFLLFKATNQRYHRNGQKIKIDCVGHGSQLNRQRLNYRYTYAYECVRVKFCLSSRRAPRHVRCSLSAQTVTYFRATIYWLENGRPNCFPFLNSFFAIKTPAQRRVMKIRCGKRCGGRRSIIALKFQPFALETFAKLDASSLRYLLKASVY